MAITTYAQLTAAVGNWLNRSDLSSYLDDICLMGEKWIERKVRIRATEASITSTIGGAVAGAIVIPSDYIEAKNFYLDTSPATRLTRKSVDYIYDQYPTRSSSGLPKFFATEGGNFIFGPYAGSGYVMKGQYYKRFGSLATTINGLFSANQDLYLFAALSEAEAFIKDDPRIALWQGKRDAILADMQREEEAARFSGSPLMMTEG